MKSTERVFRHRKAAADKGRKRKEYLVTDAEHFRIKRLLNIVRQEESKDGEG